MSTVAASCRKHFDNERDMYDFVTRHMRCIEVVLALLFP